MRRVCGRFAALGILVSPLAASAQTTSVDEILVVVAEVLKERAKRVATNAVMRKLEDTLCGGAELDLQPFLPGAQGRLAADAGGVTPANRAALAAATEQAAPKDIRLRLGGTAECRKDDNRCSADEVFVRTCRLTGEMSLSDPYFIKTLSRDAVEFIVRVAGRNLDGTQFQARFAVSASRCAFEARLAVRTSRRPRRNYSR